MKLVKATVTGIRKDTVHSTPSVESYVLWISYEHDLCDGGRG